MKFRMKCSNIDGGEPWWEDYNVNTDDAQACAEQLIMEFNALLRPGEKPRQVLEVEVLNPTVITKHKWTKTSLVTERDTDGALYDRYRCVHCGITGKRFGLSRTTTRDGEYKANVYEDCDSAQAHLEKKRARG